MRENTENRSKRWLSWDEYIASINRLGYRLKKDPSRSRWKAICGVERGGLPIAVFLSHTLGLPLVTEYDAPKSYVESEILVVDDICDSGNTLERFEGSTLATLFVREETKSRVGFYDEISDRWVVFPYEKG